MPDPATLAAAAKAIKIVGPMIGSLFTAGNQRDKETKRVMFDKRARQNLADAISVSDPASQMFRDQMLQLGAQRYSALESDLNRQMEEARKIGRNTFSEINRSYDALGGRTNQGLVSSGLFNSTVASGARALVNRERSRALSNAGSQQASLLTGLLGQRASMLAGERASLDNTLANSYLADFNLRNQMARGLAIPSEAPGPSFFQKLF